MEATLGHDAPQLLAESPPIWGRLIRRAPRPALGQCLSTSPQVIHSLKSPKNRPLVQSPRKKPLLAGANRSSKQDFARPTGLLSRSRHSAVSNGSTGDSVKRLVLPVGRKIFDDTSPPGQQRSSHALRPKSSRNRRTRNRPAPSARPRRTRRSPHGNPLPTGRRLGLGPSRAT